MVALPVLILLFCFLGVVHTYFLYPYWVRRRAGVRAWPVGEVAPPTAWPPVAVLMAVHNEAAVLPAKLATLAAQDYPGPLSFHVGSDCSTDATNGLLADFAATDARLHVTEFRRRTGKPSIINTLAQTADGPATVFVLTDASVMLRPDTVRELVRPLCADPRLGLVDSTMVQEGANAAGIGRTERDYIHREVTIKRAEGCRWGYMIGPFGGCWALRAAAFRPVPANFLVDDFYLCMAAYEAGWRGLASATAVVTERVGQTLPDEFRRKVRIGGGNWQNLLRFRHLWWPPWRDGLAFAFFSHKVLRWWTPLLLLGGAVAAAVAVVLTGNYWGGLLLTAVTAGVLLTVVVERALAYRGVHCTRARALTYFLAMNVALLLGLIQYLKGIHSNVWQPSQRN